jgi:hypothetical protein
LGSANQSTAWAYARMDKNPGVCDDNLLLLLDDAIKELERSQQTLIEKYRYEPHSYEIEDL